MVPKQQPRVPQLSQNGAQTLEGLQYLLAQSLEARQRRFNWHRGQEFAPPQSTSVSFPFFTRSLHDGAAQLLPEHTPLLHSQPLSNCPSQSR
ncbi:hypothetical protein BVG81_002070 [Haliangium sp. UPWRP_2]|nr:hypothetical protein BVG81_002070 [Haliangium sp. UPWRP_2]